MDTFRSIMFRAAAIIALMCVTACSKNYQGGVRVMSVPPTDRREILENDLSWLNLRVEKFLDGRGGGTTDKYGREIIPVRGGDTGLLVQDGFEKRLKKVGANLQLFRVPILKGEIVAWHVVKAQSFPATLEGIAVLRAEVVDNGKTVYKATYTGNANGSYPFPSAGNIETVLAQAMAYAIDEALLDEKLFYQLARR